MPENSILVSLPQLVDLALNSPEVGVVNFNVLHSLLHVLIQQVDLLETKVEFKGNNSNRIQVLLNGNSLGTPNINLTEYVVVSGKEPRKVISKKDRYKKYVSEKGSADEIFVEREIVVVDQETGTESPGKSHEVETVVVVETAGGAICPVMSQSRFHNLEDEILNIKDDIRRLKHLPTNSDLIKATRSSTPMVDMIQNITLTKRVDASEEALERLASLVEDLAKEQRVGSDETKTATTGKKRTNCSFSAILNERVTKLEGLMQTIGGGLMQTIGDKPATATGVGEGSNGGLESRMAEVEQKLREYTDYTASSNSVFEEQAKLLQNQMTDLEKEIGEVIEKINTGMPGGDTNSTDNCNRELYKKVLSLENQFEKLTNMVSTHIVDQEDHQSSLNVLLEQIELLKTLKADREYINDALADKADACAVNKKVSHDQFEASYGDLSLTVEKTIERLQTQEIMWQQALLDIQHEIESKLDKLELTPLRDFVHNKLKMLQQKLKSLGALNSDAEAAGAKSKLLRNLKCISCDAEVVMRKEIDASSYPRSNALPITKSMGPYLTYELDQLRRERRCAPHGRNLIHFESAVTRDEAEKKEHICNRYCGGSHTTTTPQQRVSRVGNFLQQWATENNDMHEGKVIGFDGQLYKSRYHGDFQQLPCTPEDKEENKTLLVTGDIVSEHASRKSSSANEHKITLPPIPTKAP